MKRPSFQFYPGDWLRATDLRSCSVGARGLWIEMICLMHEGNPYGYLKVNQKVIHATNLARIVGATLHEVEGWLHELEASGVCSRDDDGCYLSRRMIRDESLRQVRAAAGKLGGNPKLKKSENPSVEVAYCLSSKVKQNPTPASASASASKDQKPTPSESSSASPDDPHPPGATGNVVSLTSRDGIPYTEFVSVFNEICGETFPQVVKLTDKRRKRIRTLWKTNTSDTAKDSARTDSLDYWRRYFAHCLTISFFTAERNGTGHDGWRPDFDFLTSEKGYLGVLEGKYV